MKNVLDKMKHSDSYREKTSSITKFWTGLLQKRSVTLSLLFFVILRVFLVLMVNNSIQNWSDTAAYLDCSHKPISDLISCHKPPFYPFLIKIFSYDLNSLIIFQAFFSSFSWVFFSFVLSRFFKHHRKIAFLVFYLISISTQILQWDYIVLTESVSFALYALTISFTLLYVLEGKRIYLYAVMFLFLPFALIRDPNMLVIFSSLVFLFVSNLKKIISYRKVRVDFYILIFFCILLSFFSYFSIRDGALDTLVLKNVILDIASDDVYYNKMVSMGFPPDAKKCLGKEAWDPCLAEIPDFNVWVENEGRKFYFHFILTTPRYILRTLKSNYVSSVVGEVMEYGDLEKAGLNENAIFPNLMGDTSYYSWTARLMKFFPYFTFSKLISKFKNIGFIISALPVLVLLFLLFKLRGALILYPPMLLAMVALSQILVSFFDSFETVRHSLLAAISINYMAWYLVFVLVNLLVCLYKVKSHQRK